jgi:hypothetical protein
MYINTYIYIYIYVYIHMFIYMYVHILGLTKCDWNQPDLSRIEPHLSNYSANMYTHYAEYAQNINIDKSLGIIWIFDI